MMTKFSPGDRVRIVSRLSNLSGRTGTIRSILSKSAHSSEYIVRLDTHGDELMFKESELQRVRGGGPTQLGLI